MGSKIMTASEIERAGTAFLVQHLKAKGRSVQKSNRETFGKTFDLIVDGIPAEVKAKGKSVDKFDFFVFSEKQFAALRSGEQFIVFLVLGVLEPGKTEIIEIPSACLRNFEPKVWTQYYWDKGMVDAIRVQLQS